MLTARRGKGQANSDSTTYNNSLIEAGQTANITSGADTNVVDGNAADKAGGVGISVSVGSSSSRSEQSSRADNARGSAVSAGGNISIQAAGAGEDSDLTIHGSTVKAGGQATLKADDEVRLLAAANTTQEDSRQSSKSGSVGVTMQLGSGGAQMGVTASASRGTGQGAGTGWVY